MRKIEAGPYLATELEAGFWAIDQDYVRSFLVLGGTAALLVDSCDADADLKGLVQSITALPIILVQTHSDHDHIAASAQFEKALMHPAEYNLLRTTSTLPLRLESIREGEYIDIGGRRFEVLLIPGHTPGSIALLDEENRLLFSGDTVKQDTVYMFGAGRDLEAYIDSLRRLDRIRDRFDRVYPSHGPLPVPPALIPELAEGAERLRRGELKGVDNGMGLPCLLYSWRSVSFFY